MCDEDKKMVKRLLGADIGVGVYANSLAAIQLAKEMGRKVIAGEKLNVFNARALKFYQGLCDGVILSNELNGSRIKYIAKQNANFFVTKAGKYDLIELNHCPMQENFMSSCKKCTFCEDIIYQNSAKQNFLLKRKRLQNCYFRLVSSIISVRSENFVQSYFNFENFSQNELKDYFDGKLLCANRGFEDRTV